MSQQERFPFARQLPICALFHQDLSARDFTGNHGIRVACCSNEIGRRLGLSEEELRILSWAAYFHDFGKSETPSWILMKNGPLSPLEFLEIKKHPRASCEITRSLLLNPEISWIILWHHRFCDGTGYPENLEGNHPSLAKIITAADIYDSLKEDRPYRRALPLDKIHFILENMIADGKLEPLVVETLFRLHFSK